MTITPEIHPTAEHLGRKLAADIAEGIVAAARDGRRYLLGCPSGRSPLPVYAALAEEVAERRLDMSSLVVVLMDDYVVTASDGTRGRVAEDLPYSCVGFARRHVVEPLTEAATAAGVPSTAELWAPDPSAPDGAYDERIRAAGGVDLFLVASGVSDGHIAFNQPGSSRESVTRVVELGEATRRDNLATFPEFTGLDSVPTLGVSVGISTIADLSASVAMVVHGQDKAYSYSRLVAAREYEPDWPATIIAGCRAPRLLADGAAAGVGPDPGLAS